MPIPIKLDMSWSRFSNLFILNKVLRMTICAKGSYILEPKRYQKNYDAFRLTRQHRRMMKNITVFSLRNSKTQSRVFRRHTTSKTRNVNDDDDNKNLLAHDIAFNTAVVYTDRTAQVA